jgi:hypothetical protein
MVNFPRTHAILHTLPMAAQKMIRAWFKRGIPIAVKRLVQFPHLYAAISQDLADSDSRTS